MSIDENVVKAKNRELYENGIAVLTDILKELKIPVESIKSAVLKVDKDDRIRIHLGNLVFYAYDLRQGEEVKERYQRAVENTEKVSGHQNFETFLGEGIAPVQEGESAAPFIGWYLTQM